MAIISINNAQACTIPSLINVVKNSYNSIIVTHDVTSIMPTSLLALEVSFDNGNSFSTLHTYTTNTSPITITSAVLANLGLNAFLIFRLKTVGNICGTAYSITKNLTWIQMVTPNSSYTIPKPIITCEGRGDSPTNFDVWCIGETEFSFSALLNTAIGFIRFTNNLPNYDFAFQYNGGGVVPILTPVAVTTPIVLLYSSVGDNSMNYPWGYPLPYPHINTFVEYSADGLTWFSINVNT